MSDTKVTGVVHLIEETKEYGKNGFRKRLVPGPSATRIPIPPPSSQGLPHHLRQQALPVTFTLLGVLAFRRRSLHPEHIESLVVERVFNEAVFENHE